MSITRFNLICYVIAALMLAVVIPGYSAYRGKIVDYPQYYLGGRMVWVDKADDLYPQPIEGVALNLGYPQASTLRPGYAQEAEKVGATRAYRFIHPPPMAVALAPLGAMRYELGRTVWLVWMGVMLAAAVLTAGRMCRLVAGPTRLSGIVVLVAAFSPLAYRTIHTGNITPLVAVGLAGALLGLVERRQLTGAWGMVAAGLGKGASIALVPLIVLMGRWWMLILTAAISAVIIGATLGVIGVEPFRVFFDQVAPSFRHPAAQVGNQSIFGFLMRINDGEALDPMLITAVRAAGLIAFIAAVGAAWRRRNELNENVTVALAAAAAMLITLLIFSPFSWEHYVMYLVPLWGWMAGESRRSRFAAAVTVVSILLVWCPFAVVQGGRLPMPEPLRSHMLWGMGLMLALAWWRLLRRRSA